MLQVGRSSVRFPMVEFFIDIILPGSHYGPGDDSASNRNEYQEYLLGGKGGRYVGLTTLPPSCADCLEIWEPQSPGTLRACKGIALPLQHVLSITVFCFRIYRIGRRVSSLKLSCLFVIILTVDSRPTNDIR